MEINALESIQKGFLKFLDCKNFFYFDPSIIYQELVTGYEINTLKLSRDLNSLKQLYNILNGHSDSPVLLFKININAPSGKRRRRDLSKFPRVRTNILLHSPMEKMMSLYNELVNINQNIDIFSDNRRQFENGVIRALAHVYKQ